MENKFPNCEYFEDVNLVYSDFFQKLMTVNGNVVLCKTKWVKEATQNWFDREVLGKLQGQERNSLKHSRKQGWISTKNYITG